MCYFKTLDFGSIKLQGVQVAVLGEGATESDHIPARHFLSPYFSTDFSLGLPLFSKAICSEHQTRNNSFHPRKAFGFSIYRIITVLG